MITLEEIKQNQREQDFERGMALDKNRGDLWIMLKSGNCLRLDFMQVQETIRPCRGWYRYSWAYADIIMNVIAPTVLLFLIACGIWFLHCL